MMKNRAVVHEAGHALVAWMSPYVREVAVRLESHGDGQTAFRMHWLFPPSQLWDNIAITLAGMSGEGIALKKVRTAGCELDLTQAKIFSEQLLRRHPLSSCPWQDTADDDSKIDVAKMFRKRLGRDLHKTLNISYRRARQVILANRVMFDRLISALSTKDFMTPQAMHALLGARPWALR